MRLLVEEYFNVLLTIVSGLIIIVIAVNSLVSTNISINHSEERNHFYLPVEKIGKFECKDVYIEGDEYDLLKDVEAYSNSNIDIKDKVIARIKEGQDNKKYVEYILKYCGDYVIKRSNLYIKEDEENESNV